MLDLALQSYSYAAVAVAKGRTETSFFFFSPARTIHLLLWWIRPTAWLPVNLNTCFPIAYIAVEKRTPHHSYNMRRCCRGRKRKKEKHLGLILLTFKEALSPSLFLYVHNFFFSSPNRIKEYKDEGTNPKKEKKKKKREMITGWMCTYKRNSVRNVCSPDDGSAPSGSCLSLFSLSIPLCKKGRAHQRIASAPSIEYSIHGPPDFLPKSISFQWISSGGYMVTSRCTASYTHIIQCVVHHIFTSYIA